MTASSWTVIDLNSDQFLDTSAAPKQLGAPDFGVVKSTRRGGLSHGVDILKVTNGQFSFRVVPTRGMGIWDAQLNGERIGWRSPVRGPVHPMFVDLGEPSGLGWLDGFDELLVRCGLESNGAPEFDERGQLKFPLHGRIANKPAHRVIVSLVDDELKIIGEVEETRFHFLKLRMTSTITVRRGQQGFDLRDEILNLSQSAAEIQMLYHVNFGLPLLDSGSQVVAPVKKVVPRNARAAAGIGTWQSYEAEQPGFEEQVYFLELHADSAGATRSLLKNAHSTRGVSLLFNTQQLPYLSVWKNTTSEMDGYVTGIEPGTNFPNPRSFEGQHQRVVKLAPAASFAFDLTLEAHRSTAEVNQAAAAVAAIQADRAAEVFDAPQADWCAG